MDPVAEAQVGTEQEEKALARRTRLLQLAIFAAAFDNFLIAPMLVSVASEMGVTLAAAAGMASAYFLAYGLMQPVWGVASDRLGRVTVVRLGLLGAALTGMACVVVPSLGLLVFARLLAGGALAGVMPAALTYAGDAFPVERRQGAIADLNAAYAAGTAVGTMVGGAAAAYASWRVGFGASAVLAGVATAILARLPRTGSVGAAPLLQRLRAVLAAPWALVVIVLALTEGAALLGFLTFLAPALVAAGHEPAVAGLVVAAYGVAVLLWTRLMKWSSRRWPPPVLMAIGSVMLVAGYGSAALSPGLVGILSASVLVGGALAFLHSMLQVWATEVVPSARALVVAFFAGALFVGSAASTRLFAPLAGQGAFRSLFTVASLMAVPVGMAAVAGRLRYGRRP